MTDSPLPPENLPPTAAGRLGQVVLVLLLLALSALGVMLLWDISDPETLLKGFATFAIVALVAVLLAMVVQKRP